ncbi:MAG: hypothetical protein AAFV71_17505 [Cyanobacteria bacterium J06633_8]
MELESLISNFLQSHKLYCEIKKRIPDIHQDIHHQVYQILLSEASNVHDEDELQKFLTQLCLDNLLKKGIYQRIDILAINAKRIGQILHEQKQQLYPPKTEEYLSACQQLFYATRLSGKAKRPYLNYRTSNYYPDIVHEYEIRVWRFICEKITYFDHSNSHNQNNSSISHFMNWLNGCSKNLFLKALDKHKRIAPSLLLIEDNPNDNDYTNIPDTKQELTLSAKIINLIKQDEAGIFKSEYIRDKPHSNFRAVVILLCDGHKMKNIAEQFDVPLQSLHTFYKRCINKYRDYIQDNL